VKDKKLINLWKNNIEKLGGKIGIILPLLSRNNTKNINSTSNSA